MSRFELPRRRMVDQQLRDIADPRVRTVMADVPRDIFVQGVMQARAYDDGPLPIGHGQTISQPFIVARMSELLRLTGDETVLEIGTGSGYQTAVLSKLARRVVTIERIPELARAARAALDTLGCSNVTAFQGDGSLGRSELGPFNAILVTASTPELPPPLLRQLAPSGRLVAPVGGPDVHALVRATRGAAEVDFVIESFEACRFVPLIGRFGWKEDVWTPPASAR